MSQRLPVSLLILLFGLPGLVEGQTLVSHPGVGQTRLTTNQVRAYFYMRLREWPDGTPLRIFVLPDQNPLHVIFTKEVLGVFPYSLRRAWDRMVFAGLSQAPQVVASVVEMHRRVAETPGAIGYLPEEAVDGRVQVLELRDGP